MAFSPDGKSLLTGSIDGTALLWDRKTGSQLRQFKARSDSLSSVAFSPNGQYILIGNSGVLIGEKYNVGQMWDLQSGKEVRRFQGHSNSVNSVAFSPDGRFVLTGSDDQTTRLWDAASGNELCSLISFGDGNWVVVAPTGHFDAGSLEGIKWLHWSMDDDPMAALPVEIFMRDYYKPRLLWRLFNGEKIGDLPSLSDLNRMQPKIGEITVNPHPNNDKLVDVIVKVSSVSGQCLKGDQHVSCESGVYDLRLYRDGQLVKQSPASLSEDAASTTDRQDRAEAIRRWRETTEVKTPDNRPITALSGEKEITFTDVRLPYHSGVSQAEFTAYAFNADRVKSTTSEPAIYTLPQPRPGNRRRAYVITFAVDVTTDPSLRLGYAPNGAREIEKLLREKLQPEYEVVPVPLISEYSEDSAEQAHDLANKSSLQTVLSILSGHELLSTRRQLFPMLRPATPDDLVVLYIASHGYADANGSFYVIPSDIGEPAGVSEELLDRCLSNSERSAACDAGVEFLKHSISSNELTKWLQAVDAGDMVLILDSCHSAAVSGPNFKPGPMGDPGFGQLSYDKGMLVLAATQAENLAWGTLELGDRSLLTIALTEQREPVESFDLRKWLRQAKVRVPQIYQRFVDDGPSSVLSKGRHQEPAFFDFAEKATTADPKY